MRIGFIIFCSMLLFACKSTKKQNAEVVKEVEQASSTRSFSIETTPCFGRCPMYFMSIAANGRAELDARRFTEADGQYHAEIADSTITALFERLDALNWSAYKSEYLSGYSDLPSVIMSYEDSEGNKTQLRFEEGAGPKELIQLARTMEWWRLNVAWEAVEH